MSDTSPSAPARRGPTAHPIAVVSARTGLSQDVLRVWERRYRAVQPERTATGRRLYTDGDIERLRLLRLATGAGRTIGQLAGLDTAELEAIVERDAAVREQVASAAEDVAPEHAISDMLDATRSLDADKLAAVLRRSLATVGAAAFVERVAAPFLRSIGDEWHAGRLSAAHEHLASAVTEEVLVGAMRDLSQDADAPRILVATPAGERHALGAIVVGVTAAAVGWHVVYLGSDLPAADIASAATATNARVVALSMPYVEDRRRVIAEVRELRSLLPPALMLFVGGAGAVALKRDLSELGVRVGEDLATLRRTLATAAS
jgi:MerR family transcriptional regulator, light-induced transcriptional regulator